MKGSTAVPQTMSYQELGRVLQCGERQAQRYARELGLRAQVGPRKYVVLTDRVKALLSEGVKD